MTIDIAHFVSFGDIPEVYEDYILAEWAAAGASKLILDARMIGHIADEPDYKTRLFSRMKAHELSFSAAHAPWTSQWALNTSEEFRGEMLKNNTRALELSSEAGCATLVIHPGDNVCRPDVPMPMDRARSLLDDALEKLLPVAEKNKVILCIENIIAPTDTPDELLRCFKKFSSPYFGCCFDSGHANVMSYFPGKKMEKITPYILETLWHGKFVPYPESFMEKLLPHIVTCHLHDNDGFSDQHKLPGTGTVDWKNTLRLLAESPRLSTIQNEVSNLYNAYPASKVVQCFDTLFRDFGRTMK